MIDFDISKFPESVSNASELPCIYMQLRVQHLLIRGVLQSSELTVQERDKEMSAINVEYENVLDLLHVQTIENRKLRNALASSREGKKTEDNNLATGTLPFEVATDQEEMRELQTKLTALEKKLEIASHAFETCRKEREMYLNKSAAYEDLLLVNNVSRRDMMNAWNEDGEIVRTVDLMAPVRGWKKRR